MSSHRLHNGRLVPPIEQRFAPPPQPLSPPRKRSNATGWAVLVTVWLLLASASAAAVLNLDRVLAVASLLPVQAVAIGMASAIALYLYNLPDGSPVSVAHAVKRAVAGGIFGLIAAKAGAGFGLNDSLQTAAAGIGGARGPEYLDKAADKIMRS